MPDESTYLEDLLVAVEMFRYELCGECGKDIDRHTISPDMFGKPHFWCMDGES